MTLAAAVDLTTGVVHHAVTDRHRSREFIEFLELLDAAYPAQTAPSGSVPRAFGA